MELFPERDGNFGLGPFPRNDPKSEWSSSLKGMETLYEIQSAVSSDCYSSEWSSSLKGMETSSCLTSAVCLLSPNGALP